MAVHNRAADAPSVLSNAVIYLQVTPTVGVKTGGLPKWGNKSLDCPGIMTPMLHVCVHHALRPVFFRHLDG